jgi:hypothetical protein
MVKSKNKIPLYLPLLVIRVLLLLLASHGDASHVAVFGLHGSRW